MKYGEHIYVVSFHGFTNNCCFRAQNRLILNILCYFYISQADRNQLFPIPLLKGAFKTMEEKHFLFLSVHAVSVKTVFCVLRY